MGNHEKLSYESKSVLKKIKRMFGTSMYLQVIVCMFGRPELSTSTRCRCRMRLPTEVPYVGRVQSSGQGFDEKKERKTTDGVFRSHRSFPNRQT